MDNNEPSNQTKSVRPALMLAAILLTVSIAAPAGAQQDSNSAPPDANNLLQTAPLTNGRSPVNQTTDLTVEQLQAKKKQIAESPDLTDEVRTRLAEIYDKAIAQLELTRQLEAARKKYAAAREQAPANIEKIQEMLAQAPADDDVELAKDLTLEKAEQALTQANLKLTEVRKQVAELEAEPALRADRRTTIPQESSAAKQQLEQIAGELAALPADDQATPIDQARRTLLSLQQRALQSRIEASKEELLSYDATNDLLAAQRDLAARELAAAEKRVSTLQERVNNLRKAQAEAAKQQALQASKETQSEHPLLQQVAHRNAELAQTQAELVAEIAETSRKNQSITSQLATMEKEFTDIKNRIDKAGGISDVMGALLRAKRSALPDTGENRRNIRDRLSEISQAYVKWSEFDNQWSTLGDVEQRAEELLAAAEAPVPPQKRDQIRAKIIEHLQTRRKTVKALADLYLEYSTALASLSIQEQALVDTVEQYADFIDENVLWVKSSNILDASDTRHTLRALRWLISPTNWFATARLTGQHAARNPVFFIVLIAVFVTFAIFRSKVRRQVTAISEQVRQIETDRFLLTVKALSSTVLLAAMWPVFLLLLQSYLSAAARDDDFTQALASGLLATIPLIFILSLLRHIVAPHGLAQEHFRMRQQPLVFVRRHLRWFCAAIVPVFFFFKVLQSQRTGEQWFATAGRLLLMVFLIELALFLMLTLRPTGPLLKGHFAQRRGGWLERLRYMWYPLSVLLPLGCATLAAMGYFYGARHLNVRLLSTLVLILSVLLLRGLFVRWLTIARRRLAILQRDRKRAAEEEQQAAITAETDAVAQPTEAESMPQQTIFEMSRQTYRLINTVIGVIVVIGGLYIWQDVLPALAVLGEFELYGVKDAEGVAIGITLGAVATAILVAVVTVILARNVPGLLEIIVLRRLPLDAGGRFAIITICRYTIVIVGVVLAFTEIGIGWSKVQWLIAAMTVGLGFGLQEIFANFVSGLIILFEQPIRIEDVVTVGDVTGTVTKIRIRATTIRKWDQRELIVPNKEFITGRLVNWTLTDSVLRLDFLVGIAYGSDIAKAEKTLYEVADANPEVLKDPTPRVIFKAFGSSSLNFELRTYISGIGSYLSVWHSVNCAIDTAFRKAGIEIAFPQQDLHVRSVSKQIPIDLEHRPAPPIEST